MIEMGMDLNKKTCKKILAGVLILCLLVGLLQGVTFKTLKVAAATTGVTTTPTTPTAPSTTPTTPTKPTVTKIKIKTKPTKMSYLQGDKLISTGLKIKVTYSDLTTKVIKTGFKLTGTTFSTNKTSQKVTVKYGTKTTSFTVAVSPITKIRILKKPTKVKYYQGQALSTKGLKLVATFKNKKTKTITSGFTVSGFNKTKSSKVTVKYLGKKAIYYTSIVSRIKSITIKAPTKATVKGSAKFKTTGMKITVKYNNKKVKTVKVTSGTVTGYKKNKKGTQKLTFKYGGKTKTFKIKVK